MKKAYLLLLLAPSALVYACGGDDSTDGGADSGNKDSTTGDAAADTSTADVAADGAKDGGSDAPNDVSVTITCVHPSDCFDGGMADAAYPPDSGEVCCATVNLTGTFPGCSISSVGTACTAPSSCASNITASCGTDTVRGCAHAAECTEPGYDRCCIFKQGDAGVQGCIPQGIATATGAKCIDAGQ